MMENMDPSVSEYFKLKKAKEFGADEIINANSDFKYNADKIIVCVGEMNAIKQAFNNIDRITG